MPGHMNTRRARESRPKADILRVNDKNMFKKMYHINVKCILSQFITYILLTKSHIPNLKLHLRTITYRVLTMITIQIAKIICYTCQKSKINKKNLCKKSHKKYTLLGIFFKKFKQIFSFRFSVMSNQIKINRYLLKGRKGQKDLRDLKGLVLVEIHFFDFEIR